MCLTHHLALIGLLLCPHPVGAVDVNVARGKPARASSVWLGAPYHAGPDNAFDGVGASWETEWNSGTYAPGWIEVDLEGMYDISGLTLTVAQSPDGETVHRIQTSTDGSSWTVVRTVTGFTSNFQTIEARLDVATPARWVKVETVRSPSWVAWYEIEVFAGTAGPGPVAPVADPGPDQVVFDSVLLDGRGSRDPDGTIVAHRWDLRHRIDPAADRRAEGPMTEVNDLVAGFYDVTLTVTDDQGATGSASVVVASAGAHPDTAARADLEAGLRAAQSLIETPPGRRSDPREGPVRFRSPLVNELLDALLRPPGQPWGAKSTGGATVGR